MSETPTTAEVIERLLTIAPRVPDGGQWRHVASVGKLEETSYSYVGSHVNIQGGAEVYSEPYEYDQHFEITGIAAPALGEWIALLCPENVRALLAEYADLQRQVLELQAVAPSFPTPEDAPEPAHPCDACEMEEDCKTCTTARERSA